MDQVRKAWKNEQVSREKKKTEEAIWYQMVNRGLVPDPQTSMFHMFGAPFGWMLEKRLAMLASYNSNINFKSELAKRFPPKYPNATKGTFDGHGFAIKDKMPELDRPWKTKITSVTMVGPCVVCRTKAGKLNCGRCQAIKFCSPECQQTMWPEHKEECNAVKEKLESLEEAIDEIADAFGIPQDATDREERLVNLMWNMKWNTKSIKQRTLFWKYGNPRFELSEMYTNIGMKRRSSMAFRLGCENLIDIERFMEHHCFSEGSKKKDKEDFDFYAGIPDKHNAYFAAHMIAGDMDQAALDFLIRLRLSKATQEERNEEKGKNGQMKEGLTKSFCKDWNKLCLEGKGTNRPDRFWVSRYLVLPFFKYDPNTVHYDIEGTDYFDLFEMPVSFKDWEFTIGKVDPENGSKILGLPLPPGGQRGFWYMMLAIIKYKRMLKVMWSRKVEQSKAQKEGKSLDTAALLRDQKRILSLKFQVEHLLGLAETESASYFRRNQFYWPWKMCQSYTNILSGWTQRGSRDVLKPDMSPLVDWKHVAFDCDPSQDLDTHPELK